MREGGHEINSLVHSIIATKLKTLVTPLNPQRDTGELHPRTSSWANVVATRSSGQ
jgi:hypothetical protein